MDWWKRKKDVKNIETK